MLSGRGKVHGSASHIWSTYVIQGQNRWAHWLISDPLPKETRWIIDPMIRVQITQIRDPMNPCPEWIRQITDLKKDLFERNATDQKSGSGSSQRNAPLESIILHYT